MKRLLLAVTLGVAALSAAPAMAAVSVSIGEPGFFGRIDLGGGAPAPEVINAAPVIVAPPPGPMVRRAPIYLRVPPGYERDWGRHCAAYGACGQPVYFVKDDWYRNVYARHYREHGDPHRRDYWDDHHRGPHDPQDRDWRHR
ncbi:MAG TPA: hypothetical protein VGN52_05520 [Burkholderiales bacterium]